MKTYLISFLCMTMAIFRSGSVFRECMWKNLGVIYPICNKQSKTLLSVCTHIADKKPLCPGHYRAESHCSVQLM